jgi:hypothetical protein
MATRFSKMGFNVLRFDPEGLGDSEGEITEHFTADLYGDIQVGKFIDDVISAMDWMEATYNTKRFVLAGLCGGAITGLLSGSIDKRVDSLLGLGIPVILDGSKKNKAKHITSTELELQRNSYVSKLTNLKAWIRFFTFRSDYSIIFKAFLGPLKKKFPKPVKQAEAKINLPSTVESNNNGNLNTHFPIAFNEMLSSSQKILLIFGENDRLYWELNEKIMARYKHEFDKYNANYEIYTVKGARHIYEFLNEQTDMLNQACSWLKKLYS